MQVIGGMIPAPDEDTVKQCTRYIHYNSGDPKSYDGLEEAIQRIVQETGRYTLNARFPGWITSGATEGNILSLYYNREYLGKKKIVAYDTVHYSVLKAAKLLGMRIELLPTLDGYMPDPRLLKDRLGHDTVLVLTYGTTETGFIDPIIEAREIAERKHATIHVDAAFAGFVANGLGHSRMLQPDGVIVSIAVDLHKIPEAPIPLGVILTWSEDMIDKLFFESPYIPSKRQFGLLGTRPGCTVMAGVTALNILEKRYGGPKGLTERLMHATRSLAENVSDFYRLVHEIMTPILCLVPEQGLTRILERAERTGYKLYTCPRHGGIRVAVLPHISDIINNISNILIYIIP